MYGAHENMECIKQFHNSWCVECAALYSHYCDIEDSEFGWTDDEF